jgi:hypothetical protein
MNNENICPACETPCDQLMDVGVCETCKERFTKAHARVVVHGGKEIGFLDLAALGKRDNLDIGQDRAAFDSGGEIIGTVDFDLATIEPDTEQIDSVTPLSCHSEAAEAVREILRWCWLNSNGKVATAQTAVVRFAALTAATNPELINNETYLQIGARFGVTRAAVSKAALDFQDHYAVHFRRSRPQEYRETARVAQLGRRPRPRP